MSKTLLITAGVVGAAGSGIGSYFLLIHNKTDKSLLIKNKYKVALLNETGDESLWNKKYEEIKNSSPHHPTLKKAVAKSSGTGKHDEEAKRLLKEGCFEIYESSYEDKNIFSDFKNYCAKTNKDISKVTSWNNDTAENSSDNKWDKALETLKSHTMETKGKLDPVLAQLKQEITGDKPFSTDIRKRIKGWCESTNKELFEGEETTQFKNQEDFCKVIS
ncbi:hypothetical protein MHC_01415 [Mycoplasma haemocanis str. Illinois]|uniref:Uncharacterized protein n=1 Tax=Mycoplasma haemocanis (strain Illinois) TaxID=1111676 RepID=H6N677_MYCHN|nr:hypothetical protein [Mycoplasma haemocanis]AEW45149.1 hypothetical protein MHC_01415 [Mycoplasma haemocanis str. Illinois]